MGEDKETKEYPTDDPHGVIGAGFGRTGTASLMEALEHVLDLGPSLHMYKIITAPLPGRIPLMRKFMELGELANQPDKKKRRQEILRDVTKNYRSYVDFPISLYYKDLMEIYPNKKVVLTVRKDADEWVRSFSTTIGHWHNVTWYEDFGFWAFTRLNPIGYGATRFFDRSWEYHFEDFSVETVKRKYNDWIKEVKETVPADRLIVMQAKEGWTPLVKGLGIPVPDKPFPRVNDSADFANMFFILGPLGIATICFYIFVVYYFVIKCVLGGGRNKSKRE